MNLVYILSVVGANFKHGGLVLTGNQERRQEELFVAGPLSTLIPDGHISRGRVGGSAVP